MSRLSANDLKNLETNSTPRSDVTWEGVPCFVTTCSMNSRASPVASMVLVVGTKIACLVSLSTITRISVYPSEGGNCSIKSIDTDSQGCGGTGSCFSIP